MASHLEHLGNDGKKSGTSHERQGLLGDYTEHLDAGGGKAGESRDRQGFFGDYTEHRDVAGKKTGESRERQGFFGNYTEHVDSEGKKIGESRTVQGVLGTHVEHRDREGRKTGVSRVAETNNPLAVLGFVLFLLALLFVSPSIGWKMVAGGQEFGPAMETSLFSGAAWLGSAVFWAVVGFVVWWSINRKPANHASAVREPASTGRFRPKTVLLATAGAVIVAVLFQVHTSQKATEASETVVAERGEVEQPDSRPLQPEKLALVPTATTPEHSPKADPKVGTIEDGRDYKPVEATLAPDLTLAAVMSGIYGSYDSPTGGVFWAVKGLKQDDDLTYRNGTLVFVRPILTRTYVEGARTRAVLIAYALPIEDGAVVQPGTGNPLTGVIVGMHVFDREESGAWTAIASDPAAAVAGSFAMMPEAVLAGTFAEPVLEVTEGVVKMGELTEWKSKLRFAVEGASQKVLWESETL